MNSCVWIKSTQSWNDNTIDQKMLIITCEHMSAVYLRFCGGRASGPWNTHASCVGCCIWLLALFACAGSGSHVELLTTDSSVAQAFIVIIISCGDWVSSWTVEALHVFSIKDLICASAFTNLNYLATTDRDVDPWPRAVFTGPVICIPKLCGTANALPSGHIWISRASFASVVFPVKDHGFRTGAVISSLNWIGWAGDAWVVSEVKGFTLVTNTNLAVCSYVHVTSTNVALALGHVPYQTGCTICNSTSGTGALEVGISQRAADL